jgi:hypothetical protein
LKEKSEDEIKSYLEKHKLDRVSVQEIQNAETGTIDASEFPIFEVSDEGTKSTSEGPNN